MADERWRAEVEQTAPERGMDDAPQNYDNAEACAWSSGYTAGRREAIDAILRLIERVEPQWQSMETAPKDGRPFLVHWARDINGASTIEIVSGWQEYAEILGYGEPPGTHWHPIPAPPWAAAASPSPNYYNEAAKAYEALAGIVRAFDGGRHPDVAVAIDAARTIMGPQFQRAAASPSGDGQE